MIKQEKVVIGYRFKEKAKVASNGLIATIILGTLALAMAIFAIFIKSTEKDKMAKIIVISLLGLSAVFCYALIPVMIKLKKRIIKDNDLPTEALYFENGYIYVVTDKIEYFKCSEIEKIETIFNTETKNYGIIQTTTDKPDGNLTIKTQTNSYFISQLKNLEAIKNKLLAIKNKEYLTLDEFYFFENPMHEYQSTFSINDKKVLFTFENINHEKNNICIETIDNILKNFQNIYENAVNLASNELLNAVIEWNEDNDEFNKDFKIEEFKSRIGKNFIEIFVNEQNYTIYLDDDDLFFGHSIVCEANVNNDKLSVDILS